MQQLIDIKQELGQIKQDIPFEIEQQFELNQTEMKINKLISNQFIDLALTLERFESNLTMLNKKFDIIEQKLNNMGSSSQN